jgi:hypothetical protein
VQNKWEAGLVPAASEIPLLSLFPHLLGEAERVRATRSPRTAFSR